MLRTSLPPSDASSVAAVSLPLASHPYRFIGSYRLMLALLVLTSHSADFLGPPFRGLQLGNVGVMLFFVVSGAVIAEALDIFYRTSSSRFLVNRFLKIFPAYWAALALSYTVYVAAVPGTVKLEFWPILVNLSLLLSYLPAGNDQLVISIAWAVVVEFQFYLSAAALYFIARRTRNPGFVLYLAGFAALALYIFVHSTGGYVRFYGSFRFAPYFVMGTALYYAFTRHDARAAVLASVAATLSLHAYMTYAMATPPHGLSLDLTMYPPMAVASTILFGFGAAVFIWLFPRTAPPRAERADKRLGDITYAIYLIHPAAIVIAVYLQIETRVGGMLAYTFVLMSSLALAIVIFRGVEHPVMRLRNRFRGQRLYD